MNDNEANAKKLIAKGSYKHVITINIYYNNILSLNLIYYISLAKLFLFYFYYNMHNYYDITVVLF